MFSEIPKLFGKAFAIGFFLPASAISAAVLGVLAAHGWSIGVTAALEPTNPLVGATLAVLLIWFLAIGLMGVNRPILRLLEGYGAANPLGLLKNFRLESFDALTREREQLREMRKKLVEANRPRSAILEASYARVLWRLAENYPSERSHVLPTKFGNTVRAFEAYPSVIYNLDAIPAWPRLLAVIPADYRSLLDEAKAQVDFWANLWLGGIVVAVLYTALVFGKGQVAVPTWAPLLPTGGVLVAVVAAYFARGAAAEWGTFVKGAFDLYRNDLLAKMGYEMPRNIEVERKLWELLSQTAVHRSWKAASALTQFRKQNAASAKDVK